MPADRFYEGVAIFYVPMVLLTTRDGMEVKDVSLIRLSLHNAQD